jgi:hypothetical protein
MYAFAAGFAARALLPTGFITVDVRVFSSYTVRKVHSPLRREIAA